MQSLRAASLAITLVFGAFLLIIRTGSLASVIAAFQEGGCPEQIVQSFPTLTLAQAYGAIAYYLENEKLTMTTLPSPV